MKKNRSKSDPLKRAAGNDENGRGKRQRLESFDESIPEVTKITDLNDDCLVTVFMRLDLQSLFNVAIANEWLQPAADDVYKRKYGAKPVQIKGCDDYRPRTRAIARNGREVELRPLKELKNHIEIYGLKTSLQYLRCFGSSIKDLTIYYKQSQSKRYGYVHQYISDYCADSLTHFSFSQMPNIAIEQFQESFTNVQSVKFSDSVLNEQLASFGKWFPNLHRLHLDHVRLESCVAAPFQHLMDLRIDSCTKMELKTKVADLLRMNRQITVLRIGMLNEATPAVNDLLDVIKDIESLTKLSVYYCYGSFREMKLAEAQRFANEHPKLGELKLHGYIFEANDAIAVMGQLSSLKCFQYSTVHSEYLKLISQLKNSEWHVKEIHHWSNYWPSRVVKLNR